MWREGTLTFRDEQRGTFDHVWVNFDLFPGWLAYSVAENMTYVIPMSDVLEVTLDGLDWKSEK